MDTLSSCYFCSTALDASLDEYPVVPDRLRSESAGQTVVLCDTCARKLDAVFESVVEAVERDGASDRGVAGSGRGEESGGTDETDASLESTLGDDEDVLRSVGDSGAEEGASDADDDSSDDEDDGKKYTDSRGAGFRRDDSGGRKPSTLRDSGSEETRKYSDSRGAGYRRDDDRRSGANADDESEGGADDEAENDASEREETADANDTADGADDDASGADDDTSETDDDETPDVSMTRLENTKVMRLLENREFPVDKAEFVTVAASAYQISQQDCEKVLDLAIQHGLIHEEDGQLVGGDL